MPILPGRCKAHYTPPPLEGGGWGEGFRAAPTPPPNPLPQGEGECTGGGSNMLRKEQNDLLTRTGPGTPMGEMFRALLDPRVTGRGTARKRRPTRARAVAVGEADCLSRHVGRHGLLEEFCAHRRVSLWFGRNEDCGLRCAYHGWKYDVTGQCVDLPSEPEATRFRRRIKLRAYPLVERGGVLWTHMGPPETSRACRNSNSPACRRRRRSPRKRQQYSNWLQALEGGINSSHVSFLHRDALRSDPLMQGARGNRVQHGRHHGALRGRGTPGRVVHRCAAQGGSGQHLLAGHAVVHAVLHHDRASRQPSGARAFLDPDRRRQLLGVELRLPSDARVDRGRSAGDARRQRHPCAACAGHVHPGGQPRQRLPDGSRGAAGRRDL